MKQIPIDQLIEIRLTQAKESLVKSRTLLNSGLLRGAINRSYYAMFYAALALAVLSQEVTSKHSGVIAFFDREYVRTGIFTRELSKAFHLGFQRRQESDYGELFTASEDEANKAIIEARNFVECVEKYIQSLSMK